MTEDQLKDIENAIDEAWSQVSKNTDSEGMIHVDDCMGQVKSNLMDFFKDFK